MLLDDYSTRLLFGIKDPKITLDAYLNPMMNNYLTINKH